MAGRIALGVSVAAGIVLLAAIAYGVLRLVGEAHKENCIAAATANPPTKTTSSSPFNSGNIFSDKPEVPRTTIDKSAQREKLEDCKATIF
jgi:hypothetical protein